MIVTVKMIRYQYKNFEWCSVTGEPLVELNIPRNGFVRLKQGSVEIVVSKRELRGALSALDEQENIL